MHACPRRAYNSFVFMCAVYACVTDHRLNRGVTIFAGVFEFYSDNLCLILFLRGVCLRYTKEYALAENCFREVMNR